MRLLLDTHVVLWWLDDSPVLSVRARDAIAAETNIVYVSAATLWEIVIKRALGKLELPNDWTEVLAAEQFQRLSVSWDHALEVGRLPNLHRDPFDRILVAQALVEGLTFVTGDALLDGYGVPVIAAGE
jgi:PIN domain nuclease of toxin-antitoxin system